MGHVRLFRENQVADVPSHAEYIMRSCGTCGVVCRSGEYERLVYQISEADRFFKEYPPDINDYEGRKADGQSYQEKN